MEPHPINKEDDDVQKESKNAKICTWGLEIFFQHCCEKCQTKG